MAKERTVQKRLVYETDNGGPLVGLAVAIADPQFDGRVTAKNGATSDKTDITLIGSAEVQSDGCCDPIWEYRVVGPGIKHTVSQH